ncbi:hypothetical protein P863_21725 [Mycobacterium avium subsp. silvaticum ATCC 49884]|nr:hypothetical protein P863_21725 [Mycobacterium avium subsp. silvaticum ATCC 49884]
MATRRRWSRRPTNSTPRKPRPASTTATVTARHGPTSGDS